MRHVWGAGTLTFGGGSFLQLLVNSVWRVRKRISEIDAGGQIQHGAKWIQAEISYQSMHDDYTFNYLKIFNVERYLGVGQYCVIRNRIISSDWWCSFKKNLNIALYFGSRGYICRKFIQNGALFITIQILATFLDQNFQVILWRELERNNLGNYLWGHLNIIPATVFPISCYFLRIKIAATAWISLNFLRCSELYFLGISAMGG